MVIKPRAEQSQEVGTEMFRRRLGMGWKLLLLIIGGVGAILGVLIAMGALNPSSGPRAIDLIVGIAITGGSIAILVLAFWLRKTVIFCHEGLVIKRRFGPPVSIRYEQVESVAAYRIRMRHNGMYMGTSLHLVLRFSTHSPLRQLNTTSTHKERQLGKPGFSLTSTWEPVLQPEDHVVEIVATYVAPRLMAALESGTRVLLGSRIALDQSAIHLKFLLSKRSIPWSSCSSIWTESDSWSLLLTDGTKVKLPADAKTPNMAAFLLLAPVLCTGGPRSTPQP